MNTRKTDREHLGRTLRDDVLHGNIWQTLRFDFRELKEFYIDEEKKARLETMGWLKRAFYLTWWFIKILLLRLSPARRILLVIGMFLLVTSGSIQWQSGSFRTSPETYLFGGVLIIFVLMLELKDKLLARNELAAGRSVQYALMPPQRPDIPGWDVWLHSEPANDVGGDLVDYIHLDERRHALALGDVAGKGLRAALLMAKLQATVRALIPGYTSLGELMSRINDIFIRDSLRSIFASLVYVELNSHDRNVQFVNAGHMPLLLKRKDRPSIEQTGRQSPALGIVTDAVYNEVTVDMNAGDTLIAYSDGITDARNDGGMFFGEGRLMTLIQHNADLPSETIGRKILAEIAWFRGDARIYDDISMIIIKRI
jgi:phosphoserine phosphatase RsbU/P